MEPKNENAVKRQGEAILAEIITIGDEILIGQIVDTNSAWMAQQLNQEGIKVHQITSVSDSESHIHEALVQACARSQVVLITGGLGPTKDDITKAVLANFFGAKGMVMHQPTLKFIERLFARRGYPMLESNRKQAEVPDCCKVMPNTCGTAPGMWFEYDKGVAVAMPGVPSEMKCMFPYIVDMLRKRFALERICHQTMMTFGIPESMLAERIKDWEEALPPHLKLAYLPDIENGVKLRLSAYQGSYETMHAEIETQFKGLKNLLGSAAYGFAPNTLEAVVGNLLLARNASLATAESCTGGRVAHRIISVPGSSAYFKGGVVSYSNEAKTNLLGVDARLINEQGAVSKSVALEMAEGARRALKADFAIATTGVAGPGGGSSEKPVGLCWIAIASPWGSAAKAFNFNHDRMSVITAAASRALDELRLVLESGTIEI